MIDQPLLREIFEELDIDPDSFDNLESTRLREIYNRHIAQIVEPLEDEIATQYDLGYFTADTEHKNDREEGEQEGQEKMWDTLRNLVSNEMEDAVDTDDEDYRFFSRMEDWLIKNEYDIKD